MRVVFDANVVLAGAGWRGEPYLCLAAFARRRVLAYASEGILDEVRRTAERLGARKRFAHEPGAVLNWYFSAVRLVEPAPLGKRRSHDPKDDPYLACALAAGANVIVSFDADLLDLDKPFGIEICTPRALLRRLSQPL